MEELIKKLEWYKKIEVLRVIRGWSQYEAANRCFTGQKNYWSWEKGKVFPRKNSRKAICRAFGVKEREIFN